MKRQPLAGHIKHIRYNTPLHQKIISNFKARLRASKDEKRKKRVKAWEAPTYQGLVSACAAWAASSSMAVSGRRRAACRFMGAVPVDSVGWLEAPAILMHPGPARILSPWNLGFPGRAPPNRHDCRGIPRNLAAPPTMPRRSSTRTFKPAPAR